jgi:hypothetical protein
MQIFVPFPQKGIFHFLIPTGDHRTICQESRNSLPIFQSFLSPLGITEPYKIFPNPMIWSEVASALSYPHWGSPNYLEKISPCCARISAFLSPLGITELGGGGNYYLFVFLSFLSPLGITELTGS